MKQAEYKKELSVTGKNGTFTATIIATMNYSTKLISGTHPSTHDDYTRNVPIHKVEAIINGKVWNIVDEIISENMVLNETKTLLNKTNEYLEDLCNNEPPQTFTEKMEDLFKSFKK